MLYPIAQPLYIGLRWMQSFQPFYFYTVLHDHDRRYSDNPELLGERKFHPSIYLGYISLTVVFVG